MSRYHHKVNSEIAFTHIWSRRTQTFIAALGVTFGIGVFIFMNSLMHGFEVYSNESLFTSMPHLRVYKEDGISRALLPSDDQSLVLISNPKIIPSSSRIINPQGIMERLKKQDEVTGISPNVTVSVFYKNGQSQVGGIISGIEVEAHDAMFNLASNIVDGNHLDLKHKPNGLILSVGIAEKLNIRLFDNISVLSSQGVSRMMKVVALLETGNLVTDTTLAYAPIATAQQLLKQNSGYISDISVNVRDFEKAGQLVPRFEQLTGYKVEDWETANASAAAANSIRAIMGLAISLSILLVAGFGIYNILNMTIMQKIDDIAILKAIGFSGKDVVIIFLQQASVMGAIGVSLGVCLALLLVKALSKVWVGGNMGYFPIGFFPFYFVIGVVFGFSMILLAGYIPSKKAGRVDPVAIFRR